jgi:hypothetical protein
MNTDTDTFPPLEDTLRLLCSIEALEDFERDHYLAQLARLRAVQRAADELHMALAQARRILGPWPALYEAYGALVFALIDYGQGEPLPEEARP